MTAKKITPAPEWVEMVDLLGGGTPARRVARGGIHTPEQLVAASDGDINGGPVNHTTNPQDAKAEALLLRFTAEAHRRKWSYDRGLDGDGVPIKSEAFDALHRLGEEMRTALEELRRAPALPSVVVSADRATLLREAADFVEAMNEGCGQTGCGACTTREDVADALRDVASRVAAEAAVTPPPALTEAGRLRAQVEVLQQDAERDQGLAKVGARCMRDGHQGLIEGGRMVLEGWRFALSTALDLGTVAPWEAIHERAKELRRGSAEEQPTETQDSLPAWLYQRFMPDGVGWENLDANDRSYWEHHARAVRRAVARDGFKADAARPAVAEQPDTQETEAGQ